MKAIHQKSGIILGKNIVAATSFWQRLRGYMFYSTPPVSFDGLYFPRCNLVHNSFVRFELDVIFIDRKDSIVAVIRRFRPWRFSRLYPKAMHVIEFPAGNVPDLIHPGDKIIFEN